MTNNNSVSHNYIGTDITGLAALPNATLALANLPGKGVVLYGKASSNQIISNLISGNQVYGIAIGDTGTNGNLVDDNHIGTDATGAAVPDRARSGGRRDDQRRGAVQYDRGQRHLRTEWRRRRNPGRRHLVQFRERQLLRPRRRRRHCPGQYRQWRGDLWRRDLQTPLPSTSAPSTVFRGNTISGNGRMAWSSRMQAPANVSAGENLIGTNANGTAAPTNAAGTQPIIQGVGVLLLNGASNNTIGGTGLYGSTTFNPVTGAAAFTSSSNTLTTVPGTTPLSASFAGGLVLSTAATSAM